MKLNFSFNTQEGILILLIVAMAIFRTALSARMRRKGRVDSIKDAVKIFLISDLGIITLVVIYIFEATLKLSLVTTIVIITAFMIGFIVLYKKV